MGSCLSTPAPAPPPDVFPDMEHDWDCPRPDFKPSDFEGLTDDDALKILRYVSPAITKDRKSWQSDDIKTWEGVSVNEAGRVTSLDLDGVQLGALPNAPGRLTELTYVGVAGCGIYDFPNSMAACTEISKVQCNGNAFYRIPEACYSWKKLYFFNISQCENLSTVSPEVGGMDGLQLFALDVCPRLKELPKEILDMKSLNNLICDATGMAEAPEWLAPLKERGCKMSFSFRAVPDEDFNLFD